jgi:hypothetical protein
MTAAVEPVQNSLMSAVVVMSVIEELRTGFCNMQLTRRTFNAC